MSKLNYDFSVDSFIKVAEQFGYTEAGARDLYKALLNRRAERIKLYSLPGAMDFDKPTKDTFIELKADLKEYFKSYSQVEQLLNNFIGE